MLLRMWFSTGAEVAVEVVVVAVRRVEKNDTVPSPSFFS
jgi:hypothetical protein